MEAKMSNQKINRSLGDWKPFITFTSWILHVIINNCGKEMNEKTGTHHRNEKRVVSPGIKCIVLSGNEAPENWQNLIQLQQKMKTRRKC